MISRHLTPFVVGDPYGQMDAFTKGSLKANVLAIGECMNQEKDPTWLKDLMLTMEVLAEQPEVPEVFGRC